ncbi:polyprenyl synthetase family protein [Propionibacteriaceae bacterium Y1923]|uniref:polyprenyl synthetase family protein n=1 Tax=Aestuariimicrobium sp. Y1814 TaxID=3418742 RepID=UPI003C1A50FD
MAHLPFTASEPVSGAFRDAVGAAITDFLDHKRAATEQIGPELEPLHRLAAEFTAGGKRFRPAFCYWGHVAVAGAPAEDEWLVQAAASLDLLHVSALVHDDVMDSSDTRRGVPAAHRQFESWHAAEGGRGAAEAFGRAGAILLGDLLLVWSAEMFTNTALPAATRGAATRLLEAMRAEVTCGQFLDVVSQTRLLASSDPLDPAGLQAELDRVYRVTDYKSARYSVRHPLQIGAALGGAEGDTQALLAEYGSLVGRAFQFRDDLLGVFGDESVIGKPAGDDLREGKRTVLVAHALASATRSDAAELDAMLGDPELAADQVDRAREIITTAGADQAVEDEITTSVEQAMSKLEQASLTDEGREALRVLAALVTNRRY